MKKPWVDPAKQPPKPETMQTAGNFTEFTELMTRIVTKKPKTASAGS